jgi:outer membrane protein TolC
LYKEIQQAWFNASTAMDRFKASNESVEQSKIAFRFTEEKFNNARLPLTNTTKPYEAGFCPV